MALALRNMGAVQARLGHYAVAFDYYRQALRETYYTNDSRNRAMSQYRMADLFRQLHQPDSSLLYARQALRTAQTVSYRLTVMEASDLLARLYQARHAPDSMAQPGPDRHGQGQLVWTREIPPAATAGL